MGKKEKNVFHIRNLHMGIEKEKIMPTFST